MKIRKARAALLTAATAAGVVLLTAGPAAAAVDDSFPVHTTNDCGAANFVDNGDYVVVHDYCSDGHGVKAYAWLNGVYLGSKYNGNGLSGAPVDWHPFGDVAKGDLIGLKVCLVDGSSDPTPFDCDSRSEYSADG